ncbi:hypothetical protein CR513_23699, partial [Mucuna pruriens]
MTLNGRQARCMSCAALYQTFVVLPCIGFLLSKQQRCHPLPLVIMGCQESQVTIDRNDNIRSTSRSTTQHSL